jgi:PAS domain S-box-containing protein
MTAPIHEPRAHTILIVDDTPANLGIVVEALEACGDRVAVAQDGEEAMQRAELVRPDLILLDVMMPGLDGFEVCRRLKAQKSTSNIPVIFMTSSADTADKVTAFRAGAVDYVTKPLQIDEVLARVRTHLSLRAERRAAEHQLQVLAYGLDQVAEAVYLMAGRSPRLVYANHGASRMLGYSRDELIGGKTIFDIDPRWTPQMWDALWPELLERRTVTIETVHRTRDGRLLPIEVTGCLFEFDGQLYNVAICRDISERKLTEDLRQANMRRLLQQEAALIALARKDALAGGDVAASLQRITEVSARTMRVARVSIWRYTDDRTAIECIDMYELEEGRHSSGQTLAVTEYPAYFEALRAHDVIAADDAQSDPATRALAASYLEPLGISSMMDVPVHVGVGLEAVVCHEHMGAPRQWTVDERTFAVAIANTVAVVLEEWERRQAEEGQRRLEAQLRQAQKMEAIGKLAGGIAHDFNNLLVVIQLQSAMLLSDITNNPIIREGVQQIMWATERATALTRQLLTFSRRDVALTRDVDLVQLTANISGLFGRLLGEDIVFETRLASVPPVHADPGMIEQVLMNLALNARDAMPDGGRLTIALDAVTIDAEAAAMHPKAVAGRFVRLTVSDTGSGVAPEHLAQIFEPFFTTKEPGKGTGLGLATVFGIIDRHRGWIDVSSTVGAGTSFRIFLPALSPSIAQVPAAVASEVLPRGTETIVLVEDEAAVRKVARLALERYGYDVIELESATEALARSAELTAAADLLLTDLVMPGGISGTELAEQLLVRRPDLKVIFMSGYSTDVIQQRLKRDAHHTFLQKPYTISELLSGVRRSLDEP